MATSKGTSWASGPALALLLLVAGCSVTYPKPDGPYAVGTTVLTLEDQQRTEVYESPPGPRRVVVQVWYPAEVTAGTRDLYISRPLANALQKWMGIPAFLLGELIGTVIPVRAVVWGRPEPKLPDPAR